MAIAALVAAGPASGAAAQSTVPDLGLRPTVQGSGAEVLPNPDSALAPDADAANQLTDPERTDALPANPDGPDALIEPDTGALPEPEVIQPATPAIASPAAPEPLAPAAAADADPGTLPDGDKVPEPPPKQAAEPLRFGVVASGHAADTIAALQPLTELLAEKLGRPVELLPMVSYRALIDAQTLQRIDGGLFSASAYATADAMCDCLEPLAAPAAEDGSAAYQAVIVARPDSGITAAAGLAGKVVATAEPSSVGARRMQLAGLMAEGFDIKTLFARVRTMPSSADALRLVLAGEADAAFAWGPEGTGDTGQGTLGQLAATGEFAPGALTVIWRSPPIGHGPFAVAKTLPDGTKQVIRDALVGLAAAEPAVYDALSPIYGGGFVAVEPSAYRGVALLAEQNIDAALPPGPIEAPAPRFRPQAAAVQPQQ